MPETSLLPDFAARWRYSFARPIGHAGLSLEYLRLTINISATQQRKSYVSGNRPCDLRPKGSTEKLFLIPKIPNVVPAPVASLRNVRGLQVQGGGGLAGSTYNCRIVTFSLPSLGW